MKWATFRTADEPELDRVGPVVDGTIFALSPGARLIDLMKDGQTGFLQAGEDAIRSPASTHGVADVRLRPGGLPEGDDHGLLRSERSSRAPSIPSLHPRSSTARASSGSDRRPVRIHAHTHSHVEVHDR